jgi:hypothetical protein
MEKKWDQLLEKGLSVEAIVQRARVVDNAPADVLSNWESRIRGAMGSSSSSAGASEKYFAARELAAQQQQQHQQQQQQSPSSPAPAVTAATPAVTTTPAVTAATTAPPPPAARPSRSVAGGHHPQPPPVVPCAGPVVTRRADGHQPANLAEALEGIGLGRSAAFSRACWAGQLSLAVGLAEGAEVLPLGFSGRVVFVRITSATSFVLVNGGSARDSRASGLDFHPVRADGRVGSAIEYIVHSTKVLLSKPWLAMALRVFVEPGHTASSFYDSLLPAALGSLAAPEVSQRVLVWSEPAWEAGTCRTDPLLEVIHGVAPQPLQTPPPPPPSPSSSGDYSFAHAPSQGGEWPGIRLFPNDQVENPVPEAATSSPSSPPRVAFGSVTSLASLCSELDKVRDLAGIEAAAALPSAPIGAAALGQRTPRFAPSTSGALQRRRPRSQRCKLPPPHHHHHHHHRQLL